jgi:transaldolase
VSVWLDDISRERLRAGNLQELVDDYHVVGVTSNPTIFAHALEHGDAYDGQLADLRARGVTVEEASRAITTYDIRWACDVLRPVYDATAGQDGRVSLEVDPRLAHDTHKTVAEARALWWMVDRPNLFIKIPATPEGLSAITQALSEGISINVTLIFSLQRYGRSSTRTWRAWSRPGTPGATCPRSARWRRSSSAGWTPRSTAGSTRSARKRPRRCAARRPSPTRGWPTSCSSSGSPRSAG